MHRKHPKAVGRASHRQEFEAFGSPSLPLGPRRPHLLRGRYFIGLSVSIEKDVQFGAVEKEHYPSNSSPEKEKRGAEEKTTGAIADGIAAGNIRPNSWIQRTQSLEDTEGLVFMVNVHQWHRTVQSVGSVA